MAGLIPQSFIDELLSRVDIVDVVDKRVKLRKTGKNYSALCPFHQEKSPSFSVEPNKQFYYCFGCGAGGNALGFVMDFDNQDFPRAVEALAAEYGLEVPRNESSGERERRDRNQQLLDILDRASHFYQRQLRRHPSRDKAVNYLKSRGLTGEVAKRFAIGYAPPGWDNLLRELSSHSVDREQMETAGLVIRREAGDGQDERCYDRFRDRIIFPIRDSRGRAIAFGGRVLGDDKPKYLNSPETSVYHKGRELYGLYEARQSRQRLQRVLLVEGYMDVVALAQHGIHYAVATLGTATSETHLKRLFRLVPELVLCFDGDDAGRDAAWRALQTCLPMLEDGRQLRFLFLPEGEDPDSLVRSAGREAFERHIEQATPLSDFLFDKLSEDLDLGSIDHRSRLASLAVPLIRQLPQSLYRELMLDRLAELTASQRAAIDRMLQDSPPPEATAPPPPAEEPPPEDIPPEAGSVPGRPAPTGRKPVRVSKPAALVAIELLLYKPQIALALDQDLTPLRALDDENSNLLLELIELVKNNPTTTTYTMLGHCYGTPMGNRLTQLLKDETITPTVGVDQEFRYLVDNMLQQAEKRLFKQQLMERFRRDERSDNQT